MTFDIEVNGRSRVVAVEPAAAGRYRVVVDGQPREIDVARTGSFGLSLLFVGDGSVSRSVQVTPAGAAGELLVRIDGRTATVTIDGRRAGASAGDAGQNARGEQAIVAPMPGRIVRVLVNVGDQVVRAQPVVVVEAMKMENELRSPRDGRVKDVAVTPGASVDAGRILVVIE
jgi:biotin carboxyl carrier protein